MYVGLIQARPNYKGCSNTTVKNNHFMLLFTAWIATLPTTQLPSHARELQTKEVWTTYALTRLQNHYCCTDSSLMFHLSTSMVHSL